MGHKCWLMTKHDIFLGVIYSPLAIADISWKSFSWDVTSEFSFPLNL